MIYKISTILRESSAYIWLASKGLMTSGKMSATGHRYDYCLICQSVQVFIPLYIFFEDINEQQPSPK